MADGSMHHKAALAAAFVEQAPPGEVNDVITDLRAIVDDDETLMVHVRPALRAYNLEQLAGVEHPATDTVPAHTSLLSLATIVPGTSGDSERHVDAEGKRSFAFDHITLAVSDYEPYELPEEERAFRDELAKSLTAYTKNHFSTGLSAVSTSQYPLDPPTPHDASIADAVPVSAEETVKSGDTADEVTEPLTDVVPEHVGAGDAEPAPTPAVGKAPDEEVTQPGALEVLDEKVEEIKEDEEDKGEETKETKAVEEPEATAPKSGIAPAETSAAEAKLQLPEVEQVTPAEDALESTPAEETSNTVAPAAAAAATAATATLSPAGENVAREQKRVDDPTFTLEYVGNRYSPSNFWTGRWRSRWVIDQTKKTVTGSLHVDVHYYEQGNVQLTTSHQASFPLPVQDLNGQSIASQIVTNISKIDAMYQLELNDVYEELGEKTFRSLRRALPVTRQKIDWDKVGGYGISSKLSAGTPTQI